VKRVGGRYTNRTGVDLALRLQLIHSHTEKLQIRDPERDKRSLRKQPPGNGEPDALCPAGDNGATAPEINGVHRLDGRGTGPDDCAGFSKVGVVKCIE
jgi:hypothetical protein